MGANRETKVQAILLADHVYKDEFTGKYNLFLTSDALW